MIAGHLQPVGRVDPIPFSVKNDVTGLGKRAQDERMIETTVSQRRGLDSERQIKETIEQRQSREVCFPSSIKDQADHHQLKQKVAEKEALANQIASTLKPFYCALCDKQYQTVAQYDEHTNSYAHHHRQRFKDMQTNAKGLGGGKQDKEARLAKERKREEKELKRMAKARGVKVGVIGSVVGANALAAAGPPATEEPKGFKKSGWATVGSTQVKDGDDHSRKSGWTTDAAPGSSLSSPSPQRANHGFRTAGFETLETTSSVVPQTDDGPVASQGGDVASSRSGSRWSSTSTAPPPPRIPPPPPIAIIPPPPSASPPPPPPNWPPQPSSPPRYPDIRATPSQGLPLRNHRMSSSPREPYPGQYAPGDRPPSPGHGYSATPSRGHDRGDWRGRSRYR